MAVDKMAASPKAPTVVLEASNMEEKKADFHKVLTEAKALAAPRLRQAQVSVKVIKEEDRMEDSPRVLTVGEMRLAVDLQETMMKVCLKRLRT